MCDECDADRNPMKSVNVLHAIRWASAAWDNVTVTTIRDCWIRSGVRAPRYISAFVGWNQMVNEDTKIFNDTITEMTQRINFLAQKKLIRSAMDIASFISPVNEIVDDNDDESFESLVEIYSSGGAQRDHETDEEDVAVAPTAEKEALESLARLRLYEEQQKDGDMATVASLNKYEREIEARTKQ